MQLTGIISHIFDEIVVNEKFKKRDFVIKIGAETTYPQEILLQFINDKCDIIDPYTIGTEVIVDFNLRGRRWDSPQGETKFFNTLDAWKIQPIGAIK